MAVGATPQALKDALDAINTETSGLAAVVDSLRSSVKAGMSAQEASDVTTALTDVAARLKLIAADPDAPVPPGPTPSFKKRP